MPELLEAGTGPSIASGQVQATSAAFAAGASGPAPAIGGRMAPVWLETLVRGLQSMLLPVAVLAAWETAVRTGFLPPGLLSSPTAVAEGFWSWAFGPASLGMNAYSGTWAASALSSAGRVAVGFLVAFLIGTPTGLLIGYSRSFARYLDPLIQGLRPIPVTAWVPIAITIFGVAGAGAISLIALGAFYPIVVNSANGARDTNRQVLRAARMMGASPRQLLTRVVLPSSLPSIFVGLRLGLGIAWTAVVVAELIAVKSGLGYVLWDAYYIGRMEIVLADMASIGILGFLSDRALLAVEARVLHWKRAVAA